MLGHWVLQVESFERNMAARAWQPTKIIAPSSSNVGVSVTQTEWQNRTVWLASHHTNRRLRSTARASIDERCSIMNKMKLSRGRFREEAI